MTAVNDRVAAFATMCRRLLHCYPDGTACAAITMAKKFPIHPAHPERNCWGCDKYCAADAMACGNGTSRTQHPVEFFGDDWFDWQAPAPVPTAKKPD